MTSVRLTLDEHADELLSQRPVRAAAGMLLDQQIPMERAFLGPAELAERLGQRPLDPAPSRPGTPRTSLAICATPPAVHRFPRSMAARIQALAAAVVERLRRRHREPCGATADSGEEVRARLAALPGFGAAKAAIFTALLGKQLGVRPPGWQRGQRAVRRDGVVPVRGRRRRPRLAGRGPRDQAGGQGGRAAGPLTWAVPGPRTRPTWRTGERA